MQRPWVQPPLLEKVKEWDFHWIYRGKGGNSKHVVDSVPSQTVFTLHFGKMCFMQQASGELHVRDFLTEQPSQGHALLAEISLPWRRVPVWTVEGLEILHGALPSFCVSQLAFKADQAASARCLATLLPYVLTFCTDTEREHSFPILGYLTITNKDPGRF